MLQRTNMTNNKKNSVRKFYKKYIIFLLFLLAISVVVQQCTTETQPTIKLPEGKKAKIIFIVGDVYIRTPNNDWQKAEIGKLLPEGSEIKTENNSFCEIVISSGTIFRLKDNSILHLTSLARNQQENKTKIKLVKGELLSKVKKIAYKGKYEIDTSTVTLGVRGTEFYVKEEVSSGSILNKVIVQQGRVNVRLNLGIGHSYWESIPSELKSVKHKLERGSNVRGGYKIEVTSQKIKEINDLIIKISKQPTISKEDINKLKEDVSLKPQQLSTDEWKILSQLKDLTLNFVKGETRYVSPNFDGIRDSLLLNTEKYANEKIYGWKLLIKDSNSNIQKEIKGRISDESKYAYLPKQIVWNMINERGKIVPDGDYTYEFYTLSKKRFFVLREKGVVVVDTIPPKFSYNLKDTMFSPNGDNIKDQLKITINAESGIDWTCTITTTEGIIVKTYEWKNSIPTNFTWDGKGDNGEVLPDGIYIFTFKGTDKAGNTTVVKLNEITLDTRQRQASVDVDHPIFSPNGDDKLDTVTFRPILSDRYRIDTWDFIIQMEKGETARRFRGRRYIPEKIVWDGKPQKGKISDEYPNGLPSGKYYYFMKIIYRSGVNTYSFKKELILDVTPPKITLDVEPKIFSPDGDGKNDQLIIKPKVEDLTPIISWKATIYTSSGKPFKVFNGTKLPDKEFYWDGKSDDGQLVDSGEDYYVIFQATDSGYNTSTSEKVPFSIDILVIPTERGLKIRVSNIEFGFNNANLQGKKTFEILDKIAQVLKKYKKYSVIIEGHTDSTGDENYNIELSKRRAEAVGKYLISKGIDPKRLSYKGYGSRYPIDSNETAEGRARNRRVEFILIKK